MPSASSSPNCWICWTRRAAETAALAVRRRGAGGCRQGGEKHRTPVQRAARRVRRSGRPAAPHRRRAPSQGPAPVVPAPASPAGRQVPQRARRCGATLRSVDDKRRRQPVFPGPGLDPPGPRLARETAKGFARPHIRTSAPRRRQQRRIEIAPRHQPAGSRLRRGVGPCPSPAADHRGLSTGIVDLARDAHVVVFRTGAVAALPGAIPVRPAIDLDTRKERPAGTGFQMSEVELTGLAEQQGRGFGKAALPWQGAGCPLIHRLLLQLGDREVQQVRHRVQPTEPVEL